MNIDDQLEKMDRKLDQINEEKIPGLQTQIAVLQSDVSGMKQESATAAKRWALFITVVGGGIFTILSALL